MPNHLIVVEGAHDAAFLGKLIRRRGYTLVQKLSEVPDFWSPLIPSKYPVDSSGRLDRIIVFPDIHVSEDGGTTVAVSVSGSESKLISSLRTSLEIKAVEDFETLSLIADTDFEATEAERFAILRQRLVALNEAAEAENQPGFPLALPSAVGSLSLGSPRVGIYLWPGAGQQGTLDNMLLDCAEVTEPTLKAQAEAFVDDVHAKHPASSTTTERSRTHSGSLKAKCASIASILKPAGSLAVSVRQSSWLPQNEELPESAQRANEYLNTILEN